MTQRNDDRAGGFEKVGEALGEAAGKAMGRAADMAANMAGSMLGPAMQALGGWWTQPEANRAASSFDEEKERACRTHFDSTMSARGSAGGGGASMSGGASADVSGTGGTGRSTGTVRDYDSARPLYQFGHMAGQNPDYQGRSFRDVEPDLERAWQGDPSSRHGSWPEVRGYVGFGFEGDTPRDTGRR